MKNEAHLQKEKPPYDAIVVGGGFSGTMVAVHLAEQGGDNIRVALVERGAQPGRGVAYGTTDSRHLLNVPAAKMGAYPHDISHFYRWLRAHPAEARAAGTARTEPGTFASRHLYGDYLRSILERALRERPGRIDVVRGEAIGINTREDDSFTVELAGKLALQGRSVVLAFGNFKPAPLRGIPDGLKDRFLDDPYAPETRRILAEDGDVLIVGSGLTSLDLLVSLEMTKTAGTIHVLSRHGLFPRHHEVAPEVPLFLDPAALPRTVREAFRLVRREIAAAAGDGIGWRAVVDALRPVLQKIWSGWDDRERWRFLRHLHGYWDVHRHRCAPEIISVKEQMEAKGRLVCHAGRMRFGEGNGGVEVRYRPRGGGEERAFTVRYVLNCTGPQADYGRIADPLVRGLVERGLLVPDAFRMGIATDDRYRLLNVAGVPTPGLYTLGSTLRGKLYESIAVPELRDQAHDVANVILSERSLSGEDCSPPDRPAHSPARSGPP
jgi:uncharacterized NAD(P)/FAD-binding protein YdhS